MMTASGELILGGRFFMCVAQPPSTQRVAQKHSFGNQVAGNEKRFLCKNLGCVGGTTDGIDTDTHRFGVGVSVGTEHRPDGQNKNLTNRTD